MVLCRFMVRRGCVLVVLCCLLVCVVCHDSSFPGKTSALPFDDATPPQRRHVRTAEDKSMNLLLQWIRPFLLDKVIIKRVRISKGHGSRKGPKAGP
ncbi:hypothetical protein HDF17_002517 [Granulicella arctica]|uniref:Secreted protein n=1 Tax=Granulicella arctica TaxID=940613 RepID=A0A7Y9PHW1_9BACT|nr:hypothetical protein [Granulicella arctica]